MQSVLTGVTLQGTDCLMEASHRFTAGDEAFFRREEIFLQNMNRLGFNYKFYT